MNKKLLLVSLLAVGMLVGCGGGNPPASSEPGSSEQGGGEQGNWTGKYGNAGYYLVGEMNGWADFWKFQGFESFEFTQSETDENIYKLTYSVTEELLASADADGDTADAVDYKVMYWDGNKAPKQWFPDGVNNNGVINEAGEYVLTFNVASTETAEKTDGSGETYTKYTSHEKIGDANPETAYAKGEARQFEAAYAQVTYRILVEEGLTVPAGHSVYLHTWGLLNEQGVDVGAYFECTLGADGIWKYTTTTAVQVDDGTGAGLDLGFCILVDEPGKTEQDWSKKINNDTHAEGNYSIHVTKTKHSGAVMLELADNPYWLKGTVHAPYTVEEAINYMKSDSYVDASEIYVTGVVADHSGNSYNSTFGSYTLYLVAPEAAAGERAVEFQIFSGKLDSKYNKPVAGDTVTVVGRSKIYTPSDATKPIAYEVAYAKSHGVSPQITHVFHGSEYYLKGSMNGWAISPLYQLNERVAAGAELVTTLANGDAFKIADEAWSKEAAWADVTLDASAEGAFVDSGSGDIKCAKSGSYRLVLDLTDPANEKLTIYAA